MAPITGAWTRYYKKPAIFICMKRWAIITFGEPQIILWDFFTAPFFSVDQFLDTPNKFNCQINPAGGVGYDHVRSLAGDAIT